MTSPSEEVGELRKKIVREQIDLYSQLGEQSVREVARYRIAGNGRLARIIFESLKE